MAKLDIVVVVNPRNVKLTLIFESGSLMVVHARGGLGSPRCLHVLVTTVRNILKN